MKIKLCPRCENKKIEVAREGKFPEKPYLSYGGTNYYRCTKCGFTSLIFPEKEIREKDRP